MEAFALGADQKATTLASIQQHTKNLLATKNQPPTTLQRHGGDFFQHQESRNTDVKTKIFNICTFFTEEEYKTLLMETHMYVIKNKV